MDLRYFTFSNYASNIIVPNKLIIKFLVGIFYIIKLNNSTKICITKYLLTFFLLTYSITVLYLYISICCCFGYCND